MFKHTPHAPLLLIAGLLCGTLSAATLPGMNSIWRYKPGTSEASPAPDTTAWRAVGFVDTGFVTGSAPFRYTIGTGGTILAMSNAYSCIFMRQTFTLSAADIAAIPQLMLNVDYNDGFICWINGVQVAAVHAPDVVAYTSVASELHTAGVPELIGLPNPSGYLTVGTNVIAIQAFNVSKGPANSAPDDFLINAELQVSSGPVADTQFSSQRGFYTTPFNLTISSATPGASFRYTLDGSKPSPTVGTLYTGPIPISATTVVRALGFKAGMLPTNVDTHTYIFTSSVKTQTRPTTPNNYPTTWVDATSTAGDYDMDSRIVNNTGGINALYTVDQALTAIPSLSISIDFNDLFSPTLGIYMLATKSGSQWERACSFELINPDGSPGFQYNCSTSMAGAASRTHSSNAKHSFRIHFKDDWGAAKLDYPILGPTATQSFDTIELRGTYNNSWTHSDANQRNRAQYVNEEFAKQLQGATGLISTHGNYQHLYVNGIYWGLYNSEELPDAKFAATYLGGTVTDWDSVNAGVIKDGDATALNNIISNTGSFPTTPGAAQNAQYQSLKAYLDIDGLIDYVLVNLYCGNNDWASAGTNHNWYGIRKREINAGYKFLCWDAEHIMEDVNYDAMVFNAPTAPTGFFQKLRYSPDFRMRFADHVHKHMTKNGCMTPAQAAARYAALIAILDKPIVAESARWGDNRNAATPYTRDLNWVNQRNAMLGVPAQIPPISGYFASRTAIVLAKLRVPTQGLDLNSLYPTFEPPDFSVESAAIPAGGLTLNLTNPAANPASGLVMYYTLDGSDPRVPDSVNGVGGAILPTALNGGLSTSVSITTSTTVRARYLQGTSTWSALHEATYVGSQNLTSLKITEIMYHPIPLAGQTEEKYEFIELKNTGGQALNLTGVKVYGKATNPTPLYSFPTGTVLGAGQFYVLVFDAAEFRARYPLATYPNAVIGGVYLAKLDNGGQIVTLRDSSGATFFSATYNDKTPWPAPADGNGFSLVPIDPNINPDPSSPLNWRSSANAGGSPGIDDPPPPPFPSVLINEVLANSTAPLTDTIELINAGASAADVSNWYLTDDHTVPKKFKIPAGTIIPAGGTVVFTESQFNPIPSTATAFSLSSHGEEVYLYSADAAGNLTGYSDGFSFGASENNVSFGRYVISTGEAQYPAQLTNTFGAGNSGPRIGPVVISEFMYFPSSGQDEFVELKNITASPVSLFDPANPANTWRVNGVGFDFPANTIIPANGLVIVSPLAPATFRAKYNVPASVQIFGPYTGNLQDDGENLELQKPDVPYLDGNNVLTVPYVTVDAVKYSSLSPWPTQAAGSGYSLERIDPAQYGSDPINWRAGKLGGSPGRSAIATWNGAADGLNWSAAGNWDNLPYASANTILNFPTAGTTPYTATNDNAGAFAVNTINMNSTIPNTIAGGALDFQGTSPAFNQNNTGAFTISNAISLTADTTAGGTGTGSVTLSSAISGTGAFAMAGSGTLILSGANTYSGVTNISEGTLQIDGSLNTQLTAVTINANGLLRGVGTLNRPVVASGTSGRVAPGNTPNVGDTKGTLTAARADFSNGVLTLRASNAAANTPAVTDKLVLTSAAAGALVLGGNSKLELTLDIQPGTYTNQFTPIIQTTGGAWITSKFASVVCRNNPSQAIGGTGNPQLVAVIYFAGATEVDPAVTPADSVALKLNTPVLPASLVIQSGNNQNATVNTAVAVAPTVQVLDASNSPLQGITVDFVVATGNGTVTGGAATSNASGIATLGSWTLGTASGTNTLSISCGALPPITITATATPGPVATLAILAGNNQSAVVATSVPVAPSVVATDLYGNFVANGTAVAFAVASGGGGVTGANATTSSGIAAPAAWTLGTASGTNSLTATSGAAPVLTFTANAIPGDPKSLAIVSGDNQSAAVDTFVTTAPSVLILDNYGNAVADGTTVTFAVAGGSGSLTGDNATTFNGTATLGSWKLGTVAGINTLTVTCGAAPAGAVHALATPGPLAALTIAAGNNQSASVDTLVAIAPSVLAKDAFGNTVADNTPIAFAVVTGGGSIVGADALTASGVATLISWKLGTVAGTNTLTATANAQSASFTATATPGAPAVIAVQSGNNQSAYLRTTVAIAPSVIVKDAFGNLVADATAVTFAVASGGGSIVGGDTTTTAGIAAPTSWKLGAVLGANTLAVTCGAAPAATITATATLAPPVITSGPTATPNPAVVVQSVGFNAAATTDATDPLLFTWAFGDGATGTGASINHAFAAPGIYTGSVSVDDGTNPPVTAPITVTVTAAVSIVGKGIDSDGDGFSDAFETSVGTQPGSFTSTPTAQPITAAQIQTLVLAKPGIKLNFAKPLNDTIAFGGTLNIPAGFVANGAKVFISVGSLTKSLTLTAKNSAVTGGDSLKIAIKAKKGVVAAQVAKYTVAFKKGTFAPMLTDEGLVGTATVKAKPVTVPVILIFNGNVLQKNQPMAYTATQGKSGSAK